MFLLQRVQSLTLLVHYGSQKELIMLCDASPYAHKVDDGSEKPIAFASCTVSIADRKYSRCEKEGLAVIFAVKNLYQNLLGRHFTIYSTTQVFIHIKCL